MRRAVLTAVIAATAILTTCAPALAQPPAPAANESAVIIKLAARVGLLTLDHSWPGYGGTCWTGSRRG